MSLPSSLVILGSTGSIGQQTLDVVRRHSNNYSIFALTAHKNISQLVKDCKEFKPRYAVVTDDSQFKPFLALCKEHNLGVKVLSGMEPLLWLVAQKEVDYVMAAIVGGAGLPSALAALKHDKTVLLANKEPLVMAGDLFTKALADGNGRLLPVDSEHNGLFQCLMSDDITGRLDYVNKLWLTASGGPFRGQALSTLNDVTVEQACKHPTWSMGQKVTIDSATLMNKALEVIEAYHLFQIEPARIGVLIHPQSTVHAMVEYIDGSVLAHMGEPDMRVPIAHALGYPKRLKSGVKPFSLLTNGGSLSFEPACLELYPSIAMAYKALESGLWASIVFNAANEVAVNAFLQKKIRFPSILAVIEQVMHDFEARIAKDATLECVIELDNEAKLFTSCILDKKYMM